VVHLDPWSPTEESQIAMPTEKKSHTIQKKSQYMVMATRNLCVVTTLELYLLQSILCVERTKSGSNQHIRFDVCHR
jgi:hypothetical protein